MQQPDSLDKILGVYIAAVSRQSFAFRGKTYTPRDIRVSPLIFRGYTCPPNCGGCCYRVTLDYIPSELTPPTASITMRQIFINNESFPIFSDLQDDHHNLHCRNLDNIGRCKIYKYRPFPCDFELIKVITPKKGPIHLTQKLHGRGWAMKRVDGLRGSKCEMTSPDKESTNEVIRKLIRLKEWADYFKIATCLDEVITWVKSGPHLTPLFLSVEPRKLLNRSVDTISMVI